MLYVTDAWKQEHSGACLGLMVVRNVINTGRSEILDKKKCELENTLHTTFASKEDISSFAPLAAYCQYYKRYKKTYHVLQQLESVALKHKEIPCVSPAVEAMFMAELKNGLLTAGHDYDKLSLPLTLDAASGEEAYTLINGKEQVVKPRDMVIADKSGVISSIIYGPDLRTHILPQTQHIVFVVYVPEGIAEKQVFSHLDDIYAYVKLAAPDASMERQEIYR